MDDGPAVAALRAEVASLRAALAVARGGGRPPPAPPPADRPRAFEADHALSATDVERYCRQMLMPSFGGAGGGGREGRPGPADPRHPSPPLPASLPPAQQRLRGATALIVGLGGLGCPAALYLAGAGIGRLVLVDRDAVARSNLHRQIAHADSAVGTLKTDSAAVAVRALNPDVAVEAEGEGLTAANAAALVARCTVALDCTDNAATRYLLSDAAAAAGVPLVSGAALGADGSVSVYCRARAAGINDAHDDDTPCYRCLFPVAPPPAACGSCAEAGVLGPVPGAIGVLQALEAVKVVTGWGAPLARRMLVFDGADARARTVALRPKAAACAACGPADARLDVSTFDYEAFVGAPAHDGPPPAVALVPRGDRVTPAALAGALEGAGDGPLLLDVRPASQYALARLPGAVSVPWGADFAARAAAARVARPHSSLILVCRRGNDSQRAVVALKAAGVAAADLEGGLEAWAAGRGGSGFPCY